MPLNSVSATPADVVAEVETAVLAKVVYTEGKCVNTVVTATDDPWFPATVVAGTLDQVAAEACAGCQVVAECLEMTLRLESELPEAQIKGIFGATPAPRRLEMIRARRGGGEVR